MNFFHFRGGYFSFKKVFLGPAARAFFGNVSLRPPGGVSLTENVFMGHAARHVFALPGRVFDSRRVTFFLRAQKKSNQKKTAPCGALRITSDPLRCFPQFVCIGGGRGSAILKRETPQPCHLKPPRNIRLACNPLGAFLSCAHQRGSRGAVQNMERVSSASCG